ncbi:hypothetical protein WKK05_28170 [Nostoc sp. UHCC 0302]|uniref:hypothetical protein n=1 Tax=Nostoc sp. UHCC 0302 TaxID=3134896 RepID=UPI00311CCC33
MALVSPFGRRGNAKGDSEVVASHRASGLCPSGASGVMGHWKRDFHALIVLIYHLGRYLICSIITENTPKGVSDRLKNDFS